jgi:hypothetical protein
MPTQKCYRCRFCGALLPAWLAWAKAPNGALLLGHLSQQHPDQVWTYLARMQSNEDIARVQPSPKFPWHMWLA